MPLTRQIFSFNAYKLRFEVMFACVVENERNELLSSIPEPYSHTGLDALCFVFVFCIFPTVYSPWPYTLCLFFVVVVSFCFGFVFVFVFVYIFNNNKEGCLSILIKKIEGEREGNRQTGQGQRQRGKDR